jgi:nucleotide-binding universal stress UspA family protein
MTTGRRLYPSTFMRFVQRHLEVVAHSAVRRDEGDLATLDRDDAIQGHGFEVVIVDRLDAARDTRVTAAYGGTDGADDLVVAAGAVAAGAGAALRIASFAVRAHPPYTSGVGTGPEQELLDQWADEIEATRRAALERVEHLPSAPPELDTVIGNGQTWDEALEDVDWQDGDVLVVGSSSVGPIARVFLGSRASKIVRYSPVPVVVVPRGRAAELAGEAARSAPRPA